MKKVNTHIITIRNKLEIQPGNMVKVPGCEPITSMTSDVLARNMCCHASEIPVEDCLRLIPGSRIVIALRPTGTSSTGRFLELPAGPPPAGDGCPARHIPDWYKIMRAHARVRQTRDDEPHEECSAFGFASCHNTSEPPMHQHHPEQRPTTRPLEHPHDRIDVAGQRPSTRPLDVI